MNTANKILEVQDIKKVYGKNESKTIALKEITFEESSVLPDFCWKFME